MTSEQNTTPNTSPVIETQLKHVTIRNFTDEPVSDETVRALLAAGRRAPTSSNTQSYSIVVVRNREVKKQLAIFAGGQKYVETCPVFFAFCADIRRLQIACELNGVEMAQTLETSLVATVDAALVGMSVQTAAESLGLGAVMIGAMRNRPKEAAELLGLPKGVYIVFGMCIGWPDQALVPSQKQRLPEDLVIHYETYSADDPREKIRGYDRELAAHYESQARNLDEAAWSGVLAKQLAQPRRPELKKTLTEMGFVFD